MWLNVCEINLMVSFSLKSKVFDYNDTHCIIWDIKGRLVKVTDFQ